MAESRTEDPEQAEELCPASGAGELHNKISELRKLESVTSINKPQEQKD